MECFECLVVFVFKNLLGDKVVFNVAVSRLQVRLPQKVEWRFSSDCHFINGEPTIGLLTSYPTSTSSSQVSLAKAALNPLQGIGQQMWHNSLSFALLAL